MKQNPLFVGIAGGTGSGKTTVAHKIASFFGNSCLIIAHDSYYRDQSSFSMNVRETTNYDHPDSLETSLLIDHLKDLKRGKKIKIPTYDFSQHNRSKKAIPTDPKTIIIVEGILLFENEELRNMMDIKLFIDTDADIILPQGGRKYLRDRTW